ncbi:MAG: DASS family sodium-coupled anion symporter [Myxococcota bacterium]|nr:DASS family sodium-coupled anion symporter [Myxococcota bacterium]
MSARRDGRREPGGRRRLVARTGLAAGPLLAALVAILLPDAYTAPSGELVPFSAAGRATAAVGVWMATWWLTEALHVSATALLPLVLLPLLGAAGMQEAATPYAHELIFLFMGGFLIALSMERWGLHRRVALRALGVVGERPAAVVGGFMAVTAALSMWVSNTATAVMMLPVARSVVDLVGTRLGVSGDEAQALEPGSPARHFGLALLLGIAYAASIGGVATPIGTPPNLFLVSYLRDAMDLEVSFVRWMGVGLPLVAVFLPLAWLLLVKALYPIRLERIEGGRELVAEQRARLGPMRRPERTTLAVFLAAAATWITRPLLQELEVAGARPFAGLSDAGVAMTAALLLFVAPAGEGRGQRVLDWDTAVRLPWGILLLFGGGLSLAASIQRTGVDALLASGVAGLGGAPPVGVVLGTVALVVFLTELTSNTATAAAFVPILASLAPGLGLDPLLLAVPAALAASCAFMLPVATPPNAIVFGSGLITIPEMARAGLWLNLVSVALVTAVGWLLALPLLRGAG